MSVAVQLSCLASAAAHRLRFPLAGCSIGFIWRRQTSRATHTHTGQVNSSSQADEWTHNIQGGLIVALVALFVLLGSFAKQFGPNESSWPGERENKNKNNVHFSTYSSRLVPFAAEDTKRAQCVCVCPFKNFKSLLEYRACILWAAICGARRGRPRRVNNLAETWTWPTWQGCHRRP